MRSYVVSLGGAPYKDESNDNSHNNFLRFFTVNALVTASSTLLATREPKGCYSPSGAVGARKRVRVGESVCREGPTCPSERSERGNGRGRIKSLQSTGPIVVP